MTTAGDVSTQTGMASHIYLVTESMVDSYFYSADSELLVVPQAGHLRFVTELGIIDLQPEEIAILPRGLVYRVEVMEGPCRGLSARIMGKSSNYPAAVPSAPTALPIGAISKRRSLPSRTETCHRPLTIKWCGQFHQTKIGHSPARRGRLARQLRAGQI